MKESGSVFSFTDLAPNTVLILQKKKNTVDVEHGISDLFFKVRKRVAAI